MKFTIENEILTDALKPLARITSKRSVLPILACLKIEACPVEASSTGDKHGKITLTASDAEQVLAVTVEADVEQPGAACVNAAMLLRLLAGESSQTTLQLEGDRLHISTNALNTNLSTLDVDDFPDAEEAAGKPVKIRLAADQLVDRINAIKHGAGTDETRFILCSVALAVKNGKAEVVSTDGRRLGVATMDADIDGKEETTIVLHTTAIAAILRVLGDHTGTVDLSITGSALRIDLPPYTYTCKLIDGSYPNFHQVIPDEDSLEHGLFLPTGPLKNALNKAAAIASQSDFAAVEINVDGNTATVSAEAAGVGSVTLEIPCKTVNSPETFKLDAGFLLQAIAADGSDETVIRHQDAISPQVVTGALATHVIMPIRTK